MKHPRDRFALPDQPDQPIPHRPTADGLEPDFPQPHEGETRWSVLAIWPPGAALPRRVEVELIVATREPQIVEAIEQAAGAWGVTLERLQ